MIAKAILYKGSHKAKSQKLTRRKTWQLKLDLQDLVTKNHLSTELSLLIQEAQEMENLSKFLEHTIHSKTLQKLKLTLKKLQDGLKTAQLQLKQQNLFL